MKLPDGIVTVHVDDQRIRGAYYFKGDELVVTAYGLRQSSANLAVLGDERGQAAINLAKLVLISKANGAAIEDIAGGEDTLNRRRRGSFGNSCRCRGLPKFGFDDVPCARER